MFLLIYFFFLLLYKQAQARCHRIGQQKMVKVYRLLCRNTYEREMFDKASLKLGLDKAILQSMNTIQGGKEQNNKQLTKKEIEDLLKKGAYGAIMDDDNAGDKFCEEDIEQILERRTQVYNNNNLHTKLCVQCTAFVILHEQHFANVSTAVFQVITIEAEKGSTFSKASFACSSNRTDINIDDPDFWKKWAKKADIDTTEKKEEDELVISEPRRRTQIKRYGHDESVVDMSELDSSDDSDDELGGGLTGRGMFTACACTAHHTINLFFIKFFLSQKSFAIPFHKSRVPKLAFCVRMCNEN